MATKKTEKTASTATFDDFREAVRYLLIHDYGTPDLVAEEILTADAEYLRNSFEESGAAPGVISDVATELAVIPRKNQMWIRIDPDHLVVSINENTRNLLARLIDTGLFGDGVEEGASVLLRRGIEQALPVLAATAASKAR